MGKKISKKKLIDLMSEFDFDGGLNKEFHCKTFTEKLFKKVGYTVHKNCNLILK